MHRIRRDSWTRHQIQLWRNWHNPMLPPFSGGGEAFVEFLCTERKHVFFSEQPSCHNSQKSNRTPAVSCHYSSIHHPSSLVVADIWNSTQTQRLTSAVNHRIRLAVLLSFYGLNCETTRSVSHSLKAILQWCAKGTWMYTHQYQWSCVNWTDSVSRLCLFIDALLCPKVIKIKQLSAAPSLSLFLTTLKSDLRNLVKK